MAADPARLARQRHAGGESGHGRGIGARGTPFDGESLIELLRYRAAAQPDDIAYTFLRDGEIESAAFTWSALDRASRRIAGWLQARLSSGDRALLLYPPGIDFIAAFFGCLYAGVVAVPASPSQGGRARRGRDRLLSIVRDAEPAAVLTSAELLQEMSVVEARWVATDQLPDDVASTWQPFAADRQTLAFLQYTSGSTASPRGVMVTHGNLLHNLSTAFLLGETGPDSVSVSWLPVTHDMGLIDGVLQPAFSGCPAYLMSPGAFLQRPVRWLRAISRYAATRSGGPNFAYDLAVSRVRPDDRAGLDLGSWRAAYNGAEPVRHETMEAFSGRYATCGFRPSAFRPCYGLAESTLLVSTGRWDGRAPDGPSVSCGSPAGDTRVTIVEPWTDRVCADGEIGEIRVMGPSVAVGYWNRPHETSETFRAGGGLSAGRWLRTGDLGFCRDGALHVTGRIKDLLIVRGAKHFPQDLERTAERLHHAVRAGSVAAVAVANSVRGDRIALVAEVDPRQLGDDDGKQLIGLLRQAIADAHGIQLHGVVLVTPGTVPKTTSGKLQRFRCRDAWVNGTFRPLAYWCEAASYPRLQTTVH